MPNHITVNGENQIVLSNGLLRMVHGWEGMQYTSTWLQSISSVYGVSMSVIVTSDYFSEWYHSFYA